MATPERAILDVLERPEYAGGIAEVSRMIRKAASKLNFQALLKLAWKWKKSAVIQRLGFFLDLHNIHISNETRRKLKILVKPNNKIYLAKREKWKTTVKLDSEWNIVINVPRHILLEKTETKRSAFKRKSKIIL